MSHFSKGKKKKGKGEDFPSDPGNPFSRFLEDESEEVIIEKEQSKKLQTKSEENNGRT